MDITTILAVIFGLILKHVVPMFWPSFSTKAIPIVIFTAAVFYQLATQLGIALPDALSAGATDTLAAVGIYSTAKNTLFEGLMKTQKRKR